MLAVSAINVKRIMNKWQSSFWLEIKKQIVDLVNVVFFQINNQTIHKWAFKGSTS